MQIKDTNYKETESFKEKKTTTTVFIMTARGASLDLKFWRHVV